MKGGYFDIDHILAEHQKVTTTFEIDAYGLGFLAGDKAEQEVSSESEGEETESGRDQTLAFRKQMEHLKKHKLPAGSKVELPLWLSEVLRRSSVVSVGLPASLSPKFMEALAADPVVINLLDKSPYYFELGALLAALAENEELEERLMRAWTERFKDILNKSQNFNAEDYSIITRKLTHAEQKLFGLGKSSLDEFMAWKSSGVGKSEMQVSTAIKRDMDGAPVAKRARTRTRTRS